MLSLAVLKGFLITHKIPAETIDFNNYFFNKVSDELKRQWLISCNRYFEDNIIHILKSSYNEAFTDMIERLLSYDLIGFSCYKSNFKATQQVANILRTKKPKIKIIFGGPEITKQFFRLKGKLTEEFSKSADFFVAGEGELPLFHYLTGKNPYTGIVDFWELEDLKNLPAPDYSDFDFEQYPKKSSASIIYSRGCIRKCAFCSERLLYKKFRLCSASDIIKQICCHKAKGVKHFIFHDSLINGDLKGLELLCDGIIETLGSIRWEAQIAIRSDMSEDLLDKMKKSGCCHLFVGLESGCDRTLISMNKGFLTKDALEFFHKLKFAGLSFGVSIIVGFPTETEEDFTESLKFMIAHKDLIPKIEQINPFVHYDGTEMPEDLDYKSRKESVKRTLSFVEEIKKASFKCTNAFILNLIER